MDAHPGAARVRAQIGSGAESRCGTASRCRPETKRTDRTGFSWGEGMAGEEGDDEVRAAQASTNRDSEARHQTTEWTHATGAPGPALARSRLDYTDYSLTQPRMIVPLHEASSDVSWETVATPARSDALAERLRTQPATDSPRIVFRCSTLASVLEAQSAGSRPLATHPKV
jgi:hypothetical protein